MQRRKFTKLDRPKQLVFSGSFAVLHFDVVRRIMICVARSSDGARNLVRIASTCKAFKGFVNDMDVLRVLAFDKLLIPEWCELFQQTGGLVRRCAEAGHEKAQFILAKILIVTSSRLVSLIMAANNDDDLPMAPFLKQSALSYSFIENFMPDPSGVPQRSFSHCDLVKLFVSKAKVTDLVEMLPYMQGYVRYFFGRLSESSNFLSCYKHGCPRPKMLTVEAEILGDCKSLCDRVFTLLRDCKLKNEEVYVQLAEVCKKDNCDANFYSQDFFAAVIKFLLTMRQALEKEIDDRVVLFDLLVDVKACLDKVEHFKEFVLTYVKQRAEVMSSFDMLCHQLNTGE